MIIPKAGWWLIRLKVLLITYKCQTSVKTIKTKHYSILWCSNVHMFDTTFQDFPFKNTHLLKTSITIISHVRCLLYEPRSPGWPWSLSPPPRPSDGPCWSSRPIAWCPSVHPAGRSGPGGRPQCASAGPASTQTLCVLMSCTPQVISHQYGYIYKSVTLTSSSYRGILCTGFIIRSPRPCFSLFSRIFCCIEWKTKIVKKKETVWENNWNYVASYDKLLKRAKFAIHFLATRGQSCSTVNHLASALYAIVNWDQGEDMTRFCGAWLQFWILSVQPVSPVLPLTTAS